MTASKCFTLIEQLHEVKFGGLVFTHLLQLCNWAMSHAKCSNGFLCLCVHVCDGAFPYVRSLSQRRLPARPSFACSRECANSSGTPSLKRVLWRFRPLKSYQVQATLSVTLISPRGNIEATIQWIIFDLMFSAVGDQQVPSESPCVSCMLDFLNARPVLFFQERKFKSGPKVQLKLVKAVSVIKKRSF